jgi:hypothetical protein
MRRQRRRLARSTTFSLLVAGCLLAGGAYVTWAATRSGGSAANPVAATDALRSAAGGREAAVMFQHVGRDLTQAVVVDDRYAHVALVTTADPQRRLYSNLVCERVHFADGRGLCLAHHQSPLGSRYTAKIFGADFKVQHEVPLAGIPSRARVSPDGRYGATTVFVLGHSYRDDEFSTATNLIDMRTGRVVAKNLERFVVLRDGRRIKARDFNFWGVTFARDSNRFYATLATGGRTYLVEGDVSARRMRVLRENAECPSLSPDNRRIVYKKDLGGRWRLTALDLGTMQETSLAETRSVDDQVEWFDDEHVLYDASGVWKLRVDGKGRPEKLLADARSPVVLRATGGTVSGAADG